MHNFIVTDEAGGQYHRAFEVKLNNKKGEPRSATYLIEQLTNTNDGGYVTNFVETIKVDVPTTADEAAEILQLIDDNGVNHGEMSRGQAVQTIMLLLNSEMMHHERKQAESLIVDDIGVDDVS